MTSPEITDAMVEAAALAYAKACGKCNRRGIRSALSAALAAGAPMSRVKPLEWRTRYFDAEVTIEQASAGTLYQIRDYKGRFWLDIGPDDVGYATLEAAKAVAQADYEQRILSALEPAPSALVAEPAPVAWHPMTDLPETGSKFVALYDDGSGAALWFRHDGGYIDANGNDADRLNGYEKWAYLPAGFEFWCEGLGEPVELPKWGGPAAPPVGPDVTALREAAKTAAELLKETRRGSPARSPGHNARLVLEAALAQSAAPVQPEPGFDETRAETAEAIVRSARDILNRLETYAPDVGVDEFCDALHDAHALIARIDGAE